MRDYRVHVVPVNPACTDRGSWLDVSARNAKEALSEARRDVKTRCLYDRLDGALRYRVLRTDDPNAE